MNLNEINDETLNKLYYEHSIGWGKTKLVDEDVSSKNKVVFEGCEVRLSFVLNYLGSTLKCLDISGQPHWENYEYAVEISIVPGKKSFVLCDKIKEVPVNYTWGIYLKDAKEFKKDEEGNLIKIHRTFKTLPIELSDEKIQEILDKYNEFISNK